MVKGHQYVDGREGTCSSKAEAKILRYVDQGELLWWSSDATQAYQLVIPDVKKVMRTVIYSKPDIVILYDQIDKHKSPSKISALFHPDNRDGRATLDTK